MRAKPGETYNAMWIEMELDEESETEHIRKENQEDDKSAIYGKWLVMKDIDKIDETWSQIVRAMINDKLQGCQVCKCSTMLYNPSCSGPGPRTNNVICVYTCEHDMDAIGFKLVEIVKHDIKYKTDAATEEYRYVHAGSGKCTIKTIYYNNGKPSFNLEGDKCFSTTYGMEDKWHLNVVKCPEMSKSEDAYGRWIIELEYQDLTDLWYILKRKIEFDKEKFGALLMVCPKKRDKHSTELPVFHVYTNKEKMRNVGLALVNVVECNITFEFKKDLKVLQPVTLYWNDGEPDYQIVRRKGITKNWRTGENMK